jgi:hypothetical protein
MSEALKKRRVWPCWCPAGFPPGTAPLAHLHDVRDGCPQRRDAWVVRRERWEVPPFTEVRRTAVFWVVRSPRGVVLMRSGSRQMALDMAQEAAGSSSLFAERFNNNTRSD